MPVRRLLGTSESKLLQQPGEVFSQLLSFASRSHSQNTANVSVNHKEARRQTASEVRVHQRLVVEDASANTKAANQSEHAWWKSLLHHHA